MRRLLPGPRRFWEAVLPLLLFALVLLFPAHAARAQAKRWVESARTKRVALIMANEYSSNHFLSNTLNDARAMEKVLARLGFRVLVRLNQSKKQMEDDITAFGNELSEDCIALFYFSGHGGQAENVNYLIPQDFVKRSVQEMPYDAVAAGRVLAVMKAKKSRLNLVFLDACRDNLFVDIKSEGGEGGLAPMSAPAGTLIAYATQPGATASNNRGGQNSLFTQELLSQIQKPGMEIERVLKNARIEVAARSENKQIPWIEGGLLGDFYFVRTVVPSANTARVKTNPGDGAEMILIPSGEFVMGDDGLKNWQGKITNHRHTVRLSAYYIYKNLVTVGMYEKFCQATGHQMPAIPAFNPGWSKKDHPIVNVSWEDAKAYCDWAGVQLPTEAQWEKAARGTDERAYPWGNEFDKSKMWSSRNQTGDSGGTGTIGSFPSGASVYGLLDMAGNVWQWCRDWYEDGFWDSPLARLPDPVNDAVGKQYHSVRGGSWYHIDPDYFRSAYRDWGYPGFEVERGFRCVSPSP